MKKEQYIDNNPFCPICGPSEKNCLTIIHTNIIICEKCAQTLLKDILEPIQSIENEKAN